MLKIVNLHWWEPKEQDSVNLAMKKAGRFLQERKPFLFFFAPPGPLDRQPVASAFLSL